MSQIHTILAICHVFVYMCLLQNRKCFCIATKKHIKITHCIIRLLPYATDNIQGGPKKLHKVYGTIILQPYVIESSGFQQNVLKEILYMTKVSV